MIATDTTELRAIVKTVLAVARLGEADRQGWWASHAFGAAGRVVLAQRMPRTWRMAAVELDIASAASRHNDAIDRTGAVHLFSDRWPVRRWATAWVAEQKTADEPDSLFSWLETATTDELTASLEEPGAHGGESIGPALRVGTIDVSPAASPAELHVQVRQLGNAYLTLDTTLKVPYFEVSP